VSNLGHYFVNIDALQLARALHRWLAQISRADFCALSSLSDDSRQSVRNGGHGVPVPASMSGSRQEA
jgi:hypothetical protein